MPGRQGAPPKISRRLAVDTALDLVAEDGFAALTMRALAARLGVSAPTLYWHFEHRSELIAALGARLLEDLPDVDTGQDDWRDAVRAVLLALWDLAERHHAFLDVIGNRPLHSAEGTRLLSGLLVVFRNAGYEPGAAVELSRSFLWLAFGLIRSAASVAAREPGTDVSLLVDLSNPDAGVVLECAPYLRVVDPRRIYHATIELALAGAPDPEDVDALPRH